MNIILEGPKATGKTTLAKMLENEGYGHIHLDMNTKNDLNFHKGLLENNDKMVFDRFSIGEIVYSYIYDRKPKMTIEEMLSTLPKNDDDDICVILYSSDIDVLFRRIRKRDKNKKIDFNALELSNELFKFLAYNIVDNNNIFAYDVSKNANYQIMEEIINVKKATL